MFIGESLTGEPADKCSVITGELGVREAPRRRLMLKEALPKLRTKRQ